MESTTTQPDFEDVEVPVKRARGRPKGSTNKTTPKVKVPGRGRGRPKGSTNKTTPKVKVPGMILTKGDDSSSADEDIKKIEIIKMKNGRGRPSLNPLSSPKKVCTCTR